MSDRFWVTAEPKGGLLREEIAMFKAYVQPGDKLTCYTGRATEKKPEGDIEQESVCVIKRKYPHHALTTKGTCYQWSMLAIWNRNVVEKAKKWASQQRRGDTQRTKNTLRMYFSV